MSVQPITKPSHIKTITKPIFILQVQVLCNSNVVLITCELLLNKSTVYHYHLNESYTVNYTANRLIIMIIK